MVLRSIEETLIGTFQTHHGQASLTFRFHGIIHIVVLFLQNSNTILNILFLFSSLSFSRRGKRICFESLNLIFPLLNHSILLHLHEKIEND